MWFFRVWTRLIPASWAVLHGREDRVEKLDFIEQGQQFVSRPEPGHVADTLGLADEKIREDVLGFFILLGLAQSVL